MRALSMGVAVALLLAGSASAGGVKLTVQKNGTKLITNEPTFRGRNLDWFATKHDRRSKYDPLIERFAAKYGVDPVLVRAVIQVESDFNPNCVSHKGARGLMQLMPETAKRFNVTKVHDAEQNIRGGIQYLAYLVELFGDMPRALAAYNAGEGAVLKYGGIPPYEETSTYVSRAMTVYHGRPYGGAGATMIAGRKGGPKLLGGFGRSVTAPVAAALLPGVKYLGTR